MKKLFRRSEGKRNTKFPIKLIVAVAAAIFLASGFAWWYYVHNSPERLYWAMIRNNLNTTAFARTVVQDDGQQGLNQVVEVRTSPQHIANSRSIITQGEAASTRVVTESVGTPRTDYVRYTDIKTAQKSSSGGDLDFSNVVNVWGMAEADSSVTNGQLYNESVLGLFPFGSLNARQQGALLEKMQNNIAYQVTLVRVDRAGLLRRPSYVYSVQINPSSYIAGLKAFAHEVGLTQLESVDPAQYKSTQPITVQVTVDGWSRQLKEVSYGSGSRIEKFTSFNSIKPLAGAPNEAISINELQARLQLVQ